MVVEATHRFDLLDDPWFHPGFKVFLLVNDFHGYEFTGFDGTSYMEFGKASTSKSTTEFRIYREEQSLRSFQVILIPLLVVVAPVD